MSYEEINVARVLDESELGVKILTAGDWVGWIPRSAVHEDDQDLLIDPETFLHDCYGIRIATWLVNKECIE